MRPRLSFAIALTLAAPLVGCRGQVYEDGPNRPGRALRCGAGDALPAAAPLRRLSEREYARTVRDLFAPLELPELTFPERTALGRFDTGAEDQVVSPVWVERSQSNAEAIAERAVADRGWMECGARDATECAREVLPALFSRAYRRPLDATEREAIASFYEASRADYGEATALRMALEALLISPDFLYRPELAGGGDAPEGFVALSDHELAARLSYTLWGTMPDAELRRAADAGELAGGGLEAQARRMIADPRARDVTSAFFAQWLELARLETARSDAFPELDGAMRRDLRESVLRFAQDAFWEQRSYDALVAGTHGYVNDRIATAFGVAPPGSEALVRTELDPEQRAGILTQPGWLASSTHGVAHSPIIRGLFVIRNVLCGTIEPPPADVNTTLPDEIPAEVRTTRQLFEQTHGTQECATCHARIDGAGFAFERYDAIGRFRTTENGVEVDPSAAILGAGDANGEYTDALAMIDRFAGSERVRECVVRQLYRFTMGRQDQSGDACQVRSLSDELREHRDTTELLVAIATSPSFRFRPEVSE
ncbi:MAG: DUF1592 domain-containing protein [Sandaracinaceae bacterium]|nr:DUF1592 domain-containing protein [Sandaracinaceae bacterium]